MNDRYEEIAVVERTNDIRLLLKKDRLLALALLFVVIVFVLFGPNRIVG